MLANKRKSASFSASELSLFKKFSNENITSATIGGIGIQQGDERILVQYYVNENTLREKLTILFFKNQTTSLRIRIARFILKLLTCVLYIIRVILDTNPILANCFGCAPLPNKTDYLKAINLTQEEYLDNPVINWDAIYWVHRSPPIWLIQVILSIISINETMLLIWLNYKGNIFQQLLTRRFGIELVTTVPFTTTIFYAPLRHLFVPVFLNCWLAKYALENMFNDLHRAMQRSQSALSQQLTILTATLICLVFTSVCGVQHFQRAGHRQLDLFQSTYFVIVTFSTVGYGDYVPDIWPSQLFMIVMIGIALIVLPTQFEQLAFTWMERQKLGGNYSSHRAQTEKHVVVCSTTLHTDTIMDFLNEFYAHPLLQSFFVVLLSPSELDPTMRMILSVPIWSQRVIYLQGSCLKDNDLIRARMGEAEACFILAARNYADKTAADEHTILRSWAVKDFAPNVPQYVQIVRPDNKLHVRFAEHVVCEDEFKYALLANNCLFPGSSTLVTLLLHTSRGQEGQTSKESWQRLYGKCSGNEIYHIRLGDSRFFGEYEGKSFTYASFHSHRKFGVCLVGVRPAQLPEFYEDTILLNPGPKHIMKKSDLCFYLSITKEEHSAFIVSNDNGNPEKDEQENQGTSKDKPEAKKSNKMNCKSEIEAQELHQSNVVQIEIEESPKENEKKSESKTSEKVTKTSNLLSIPTGSNTLGIGTTDETQLDVLRRPSILPVPESFSTTNDSTNAFLPSNGSSSKVYQSKESSPSVPVTVEENALDNVTCSSSEEDQIIKGFPPTSPYIGVTPTLCYLLKEKKQLCCLQLAQACSHCSNRTAYDYHWTARTIILSSDSASSAIYNFIIPLRAHFRPKDSLSPIVLLLERRPDISFLDAISVFPLIYWFLGSIDNLDDLLRAGITLAENVVVVNKEINNSAEEDTLSDCNTIVAVQTMYRFFPHIKIVTELSQSNNMRFMQFNADDQYALHLSRMEKREKERGSHISYMFRLPFAAGSVFSASMLDTLLYQAFVKDYLITFVRLLLGIDQAPGSGFLTSMQITQEDLWIRSYGRLYQKLCSTTLEIPIGIYRTQESSTEINHEREQSEDGNEDILEEDNDSFSCGGTKPKTRNKKSYFKLPCRGNESSVNSSTANSPVVSTSSCTSKPMLKDHKQNSLTHSHLIERAEILNLVKSRMKCLGLPEAIDHVFDKDLETNTEKNTLSYVIINPSCDLKLRNGDIIYLIRPSWGDKGGQNIVNDSEKKSEHAGHTQVGKTEDDEHGSLSSKQSLPYQKYSLDSETNTHEHSHQKRSNSLRMHHTYDTSAEESPQRKHHLSSGDDILLRRSNSLRQGLGINAPPTISSNTGLPSGIGRRRLSSSLQKRKTKHEDGATHFPPTIHIINSTSSDEINLNGQGCSSSTFTHNLGTTGATNSDSNTGTIV